MKYPLVVRCESENCDCGVRSSMCFKSDKHRYVYYAAPKCCSNTMKKILPDVHPCNHPERYTDYLSFGVVRNPWDIMVSMYVNSTLRLPHFGKSVFGRDISGVGFGEFIDMCKEVRNHHWEQITRFIPADVDLILRYEDFNDDINRLGKKLNLKLDSNVRSNLSKHRDFKTYYDDDLVAKVGEMYVDDLVRFNYRWDK